jgi:two-component system, NtrC family, sensor kinase
VEQANIDLARAMTDVKTAQAQLMQAERMASLGELTAGIAHEIQNPLNFINNFSEATEELLQEIEEYLQTGNYDEAAVVIEEAKQNLQKITHHGKRAESVVKGMLQHSRKSDGQKVPTDINALVTEYLQLSYQGLRARDKSMNASLEKNLDNGIGKIEVVPQDIGRVLLNLFNNAFYAVNEKKKKLGAGFEPLVKVETRKAKDGIEISVRDNGTGVPPDAREKIFQPFFTTKPTGEGTGLGLSLSHDIITNEHGGTIRFETKDGEGTTFLIHLPA